MRGRFIIFSRGMNEPTRMTFLLSFMIVPGRLLPIFFYRVRKKCRSSFHHALMQKIESINSCNRGPLFSTTSREKCRQPTWRGRHKPPVAQVIVQALSYNFFFFFNDSGPPLEWCQMSLNSSGRITSRFFYRRHKNKSRTQLFVGRPHWHREVLKLVSRFLIFFFQIEIYYLYY